jgi:hypothetical protein
MSRALGLLVLLNLSLVALVALEQIPKAQAAAPPHHKIVVIDRCVPDNGPGWCLYSEHQASWQAHRNKQDHTILRLMSQQAALDHLTQNGWSIIDAYSESLRGAVRITLQGRLY